MENEMRELNLDELDQVSGGVERKINTRSTDKAQIRSSPEISSGNRQDSLVNGTIVNTVTDELIYDPVSGRHFVKIEYTKNGQDKVGYVASSILGMGW